MAFESITNDAGATTGYTYEITEGDVTNTITYDANFEQIEEAIEEMGKFDIVVQSKLKEVFLEHILPLKEAA